MKDHLGNVRVTFTDKDKNGIPEVQSENHYYPFGMPIAALSYTNNVITLNTIDFKNEYFYNGKEAEDDFGLGWLDYGARMYDPVVGRWWSVDPLAEKNRKWSPYSYCKNDPMNRVDPDGMLDANSFRFEPDKRSFDDIIHKRYPDPSPKPFFEDKYHKNMIAGVNDWYKNKKTGGLKWFKGSGKQEGYDNVGGGLSSAATVSAPWITLVAVSYMQGRNYSLGFTHTSGSGLTYINAGKDEYNFYFTFESGWGYTLPEFSRYVQVNTYYVNKGKAGLFTYDMLEGHTYNINFGVAAGLAGVGISYAWMYNNDVGIIKCTSLTVTGGISPVPISGGYTRTTTWMSRVPLY